MNQQLRGHQPRTLGHRRLRVPRERRHDGDADAADGDLTDGYWRSCVRNRDASWDVDPAGNGNQAGIQQRAGLDFAQYSCGDDRRTGTCAAPMPS